jgi:hypothetical protein
VSVPSSTGDEVMIKTSAFNTQTPGKYPEDHLLLQQHGESLKTRNFLYSDRTGTAISRLFNM